MKVAFTTKGTLWESPIDPRFGRAEFLMVYDEGKKQFNSYDNRSISEEAHGAGPQTAQKLFELKADILITGNGPGGNASRVLEKAGMTIYVGAGDMNVREAYESYKRGKLKKFDY